MKAASAQPPPRHPRHGLKFHWPQRPPVSLALAGFLVVSVLAHGLAFYILQVVDPPSFVAQPPPVQVNMLTDTSPENRAVLQWIEANDPAAIANTHEIVPGGLDVPYQRSLSDVHPVPKSPEGTESAVAFPPAVDTMSVLGSAQQPAAASPAEMLPPPTDLRFSGALAGRKITKEPALKFDASVLKRERDSFMIGVGPDGKVMYTFYMGVELDAATKAVERQVEACLEQVEFSKQAGNSIAWGTATFYWGDDSDHTGGTQPQGGGNKQP